MGWLSERRVVVKVAKEQREVGGALLDHLDGFVTARWSTEAQLEQPTSFNKPSILLMAAGGESIRRAIPSIAFDRGFTSRHDILAHDVGMVSYPQHMRECEARSKRISG